jgi:hypothetical protein
VRARFDWKLHGLMTVLTLGIWLIVALSAAAKRLIWPWTCEHCGWHEPDFRSPEERRAGQAKPRARAGESGSWLRRKDGSLEPRSASKSSPEEPPSAG